MTSRSDTTPTAVAAPREPDADTSYHSAMCRAAGLDPETGLPESATAVAAPSTLGDALPAEMTRVRDEVMPPYIQIGPPGIFALTMMRAALDGAAKAMAEGDLAEMIHWYQELKGFHL